MAKAKSKIKLKSDIPNVSFFEERFIFVGDDILRSNLAKDFQYLVFLIALLAEMDIEDTNIGSSIRRDMIVHSVSIIEGLLFYVLKVYIENDQILSKSVMPSEWKYENVNVLYKIIENDKEVISGLRHKKHKDLTPQIRLDSLNEACKKASLIEEVLYNEIDEIRKLRNDIHLAGLTCINVVDKDTVDKVFNIAGKVKTAVQEKINALRVVS